MTMSLPLKNNIKRFYVFWWGDHGLSALFVILILLFFLSPFIETTMTSFFLAIFYIPLLIAGVASASQSRFLRSIAIITAAIVMAFNILHQNFPGRIFTGCWYLSIVTFFFLLIGVLINQVFRDGPVTRHRVRGAIAAYLLIGITWTYIYLLITFVVDGAFSFPPTTPAHPDDANLQSTLAYFSFVTLTTLGYGDTVPIHPVARMFAILEALLGLLYPATLLARLVSLEIMYSKTPKDQSLRDDPESRKDL
jgi:hypothetical protein